MNKICKKCLLELNIVEFTKNSKLKSGISNVCKYYTKKHREENKEYNRKYALEYRENNKLKSQEYAKKYYKDNKSEFSDRNKKYRTENKESISKYMKVYSRNNISKINKHKKNYVYLNKDKVNNSKKEYTLKNKEKRKEWYNEYRRIKRKKDILYKVSDNIRCMIRSSFRNKSFDKNSKASEILGCSFEYFISHIESKFEYWMSWDNHGKYTGNYNDTWQYDHIVPISSALNIEDLIRLNHYTNLTPLCSRKNLEKSNKNI